MATHSSILAWRIPWTEGPGRLQSIWLQKVGHNWVTNTFTLSFPGAQMIKNLPAMQETQVQSWVGKIPWRREWLQALILLGFPGGSYGKKMCLQCGRDRFNPWAGRSPGEGGLTPGQEDLLEKGIPTGYPLQYSCLENSMNRGAWRATDHGWQRVGHHWVTNTFTLIHNIKFILLTIFNVQFSGN